MPAPFAPLLTQLSQLEREVLELEPEFRRAFLRIRQEVEARAQTERQNQSLIERQRRLLDSSLRLAAANGVGLIASEVLDVMIRLVGAKRGFVGLLEESQKWRFLAARAIEEKDIEDPAARVSTGIIREALQKREPVLTADASQDDWAQQHSVQRLNLQSVACLPIQQDGRLLGFVYLDDPTAPALFDQQEISALESWLPIVAEHLARELSVDTHNPFPAFVTRSTELRAELRELARLARFDVSVLITGPTGTGKSMLAQALHQRSHRANGPFIHLNCSAVPESLLEGELFGSEAGAYTGSKGRRIGKFEAANGGTLFLDEIDTMPLSGQVKLLVALQGRQITRLGSNQSVQLDARVIAATNADPQRAIAEKRLREDLYFRLAKAEVHLPALAERREDLPLLIQHLLARTQTQYHLPTLRLTKKALDTLCAHDWPGNVRELENVLDRAALLADESGIISDVRLSGNADPAPRRLSVGRDEFLAAWARAEGVASETARILGVTRRSIFRLKNKYLDD